MSRLRKSIAATLPLSGLATAVLWTAFPAQAQQPGGPGYGGHMWNDGWHGSLMGSVMMPVMMLVFLAVAALVIVVIVRWAGGTGHGHAAHAGPPATRTALDLLRDRYARGEIDTTEFEERRRVLGE